MLIPINSFSTIIYIVIRNHVVYVASDTRASFRGIKGYHYARKIKQIGKYYMVLAGSASDSVNKYFPYAIVKKDLANADITSKLVRNRIKKDFLIQLKRVLLLQKPILDSLHIKRDDNSIDTEIGIVGFKNNIPIVAVITFRVINASKMTLRVTDTLISDNWAYPMGLKEQFVICAKKVTLSRNDSYPTQMYNLLDCMTTNYPEMCGKPIEILKAENGRFSWVPTPH